MKRALVAAVFVLGFGLAGGFSATVIASTTGTTTTGTTATSTATTSTDTGTTSTTTTMPTTTTTPKPRPKPKPDVIPARVSIAGIPVGKLTREQAAAKVRLAFLKPLPLTVADTRYALKPSRFGAVARIKLAVAHARSAASGTDVPLVVTVEGAQVRAFVDALATRFDRLPVDSTLTMHGSRPYVSKDVAGRTLLRKDAVQAIVRSLVRSTRTRVVLQFAAHPAKVTAKDFGPLIVIQRGSNRLTLYQGAHAVRTFPVATGQAIYPTPLGHFQIVVKWVNPTWYPPTQDAWAKGLKPVPPGPNNPLGTRWMGLSSPGVGIHGTDEDSSIGYSESHGCIRMHVPDAEWLFGHVDIGTPVYIVSS